MIRNIKMEASSTSPEGKKILKRVLRKSALYKSVSGNRILRQAYPYRTDVYRVPLDLQLIKLAKENVYSREDHSRYDIDAYYKRLLQTNIMIECINLLTSQIMPFGINIVDRSSGKISKDLTWLINGSMWINKVVSEWIQHTIQGVSLLQFEWDKKTGEVLNAWSIERYLIDTYSKRLRLPKDAIDPIYIASDKTDYKRNGFQYDERSDMIEILRDDDLFAVGDLFACSKSILISNGTEQSYADYCGYQARPFLVVKTDSRNREHTKFISKQLMDAKARSTIIVDKETEVDKIYLNDSSSYRSFGDLILIMDGQLKAALTGQNYTSGQISQASTAEAQERLMNAFIASKKERFKRFMYHKVFRLLDRINGGNNPYKRLNILEHTVDYVPPPQTDLNVNSQATAPPSKKEKKGGNPNAT